MKLSKTVTLTTEEIKMIVKEKTKEWSKKSGYGKKQKTQSAVSRAIADVLSDKMKMFRHGFDKEKIKALADIFGLITGEEVFPEMDLSFSPLVMVVPTKNPNDHNYPLNKPCLLIKDQGAIMASGNIGNRLPTSKKSIRPATTKQIDSFFEKIEPLTEEAKEALALIVI